MRVGKLFANPLWWRIRCKGRLTFHYAQSKEESGEVIVDKKYSFCFNNREEYIEVFRNLMEVFITAVYNIDIKGKVVLDIGANVADTPIYFVGKGAKKVIGVEPFPVTYQLARENVNRNNLSNKIKLVNAAIGGKPGSLKLTNAHIDTGSINALKVDNKGSTFGTTNVPITTLARLVKKYHLKDAVLKLDCEGAEYDAIMSADIETLRIFSDVIIEYDYGGIEEIKDKMQSASFYVASNDKLHTLIHFKKRESFKV
jgi:FkbM family methyltransferase